MIFICVVCNKFLDWYCPKKSESGDNFYSLSINRHSNTLTTNTITCGVLLSAGDMIQQKLEKAMGKKQTDTKNDMIRTG